LAVSDTYILDVIETTLHNVDTTLHDNVFSGHILTYLILERAKKNAVSGGLSLVKHTMTGSNPTIALRNPYKPVPVEQYPFLNKVQFPWSHISGSVVSMDEDRRVNRDPHLVKSYVNTMVQNTEESFTEYITGLMYSDGTAVDGEVFYGLLAMIDDNNIYGRIMQEDETFIDLDRSNAAYSWWRSQCQANVGPFKVEGVDGVRHMLLKCRNGNRKKTTDVILCNEDIWLAWVAKYGAQQPLTDPELAKIGFENIQFGKTKVFYDEDCPSGTILYINSDEMELQPDTENSTKFKQSNWKDLPGGLPGQYKRLGWTGQLTCMKPRYFGKMEGVTV
jgi:hypothetical protein